MPWRRCLSLTGAPIVLRRARLSHPRLPLQCSRSHTTRRARATRASLSLHRALCATVSVIPIFHLSGGVGPQGGCGGHRRWRRPAITPKFKETMVALAHRLVAWCHHPQSLLRRQRGSPVTQCSSVITGEHTLGEEMGKKGIFVREYSSNDKCLRIAI